MLGGRPSPRPPFLAGQPPSGPCSPCAVPASAPQTRPRIRSNVIGSGPLGPRPVRRVRGPQLLQGEPGGSGERGTAPGWATAFPGHSRPAAGAAAPAEGKSPDIPGGNSEEVASCPGATAGPAPPTTPQETENR